MPNLPVPREPVAIEDKDNSASDALMLVIQTLEKLPKVDRSRVYRSAGVYLGEWQGKDPREQRGDDDCT